MVRSELYTKYLGQISLLAEKLDNLLDRLPCFENETMEESEIRHSIYEVAEKLNDAKRAINYFSKPTKEGYLIQDSNGKFKIAYYSGGTSYPLGCGSSIEVYLQGSRDLKIDEGWYCSRVEYSNGYYFYGFGNPRLFNGMKVRTRVGD
ncbi:MAG: DUF5348 domain-containing protein [Bacillota bacterium]|nr:DUF5348 domain-containing protein [Bacillota bacterium]